MKEDLDSIKDIVIMILDRYPETRNSDHYLEWIFLLESGLAERKDDGIFISFENWRKKVLASVRRIRRKLQEEGFYLPDDTVNSGRLEKESEMRHEFAPGMFWSPSPSDNDFRQKVLWDGGN